MSGHCGPYIKLITDGLVAAYDFGDPACFVSSSTTFFNLNGDNYTGSFNVSPVITSSFSIRITNPIIGTMQSTLASLFSQTQWVTMGAWIYSESTSSNYTADEFIFSLNNTSTPQNHFGIAIYASADRFVITRGTGSLVDPHTITSYTTIPNNWVYVVCQTSASSVKGYINGTISQSFTTQSSMGPRLAPFDTVLISTSLYRFRGFIAHIHFYNKILSSEEILQNYDSLKPRFNII